MKFDDLMRQAGLEAIKVKDHRAAAGQEMTSPEQDRYHAAYYFACLVRNTARAQALELSEEQLDSIMRVCIQIANRYAFVGDAAFPRGREKLRDAIRLLGEDAGRGGNG